MKQNNSIKQYIKEEKLDIEKIMKDFTPYIYTIAKNKNANLSEEDIEEIVSDVFLAIWKNQDKLEIKGEIKNYLAGITRNTITNKLRKIKNNESLELIENYINNHENIEIETENLEIEKIIMYEIEKMKKEDNTIFIQYYYYSKSIKEIAQEFNISESKIKSRLFRIRKKLKKALEKRGYSYNG